MASGPNSVVGTYVNAGTLQTIWTPSNPNRLTEVAFAVHASTPARVTAKFFINTYTYLSIPIDPGEGYALECDGFVGASTGVQISFDAAAQNLAYYKVSMIDDVNSPAGGPQVVGARMYHTAGAGIAQQIWTPPAAGGRLVEVALANVGLAKYKFTLYHGVAGWPFATYSLSPGEAIPIRMKSIWANNAGLALVVDAPASNTQIHYTSIEDIANAQGAAA
jgi:hypothetical protein